MTIKEKREWAELLVARTAMNQKEIAQKVGVTPKTMSGWWNKYSWEQLRNAHKTSEQLVIDFQNQIEALTADIKARKNPWPTKGEADTLSKLNKNIRDLRREDDLSSIVGVFIRFIDWMRDIDLDKAKEISDFMDRYIKDRI